MKKKKTTAPPVPRRPYLKPIVWLIVVLLFLGVLIWGGRTGLEYLRGKERYDIPFMDIECKTPVGMDRHDFLDEVRYPGRLPERLNLLDDALLDRLRVEFARHPWVERVDGVERLPPRRVVVALTLRVPVLAVRVGDKLRAVDASGVVLPMNAPTLDLPIFEGEASPPAQAGKRWGDPNVEAAARRRKGAAS